jgi:hypothetical protein
MPMFPFGSPAATNLLLTNPDAEMPVSTLPFIPATDGDFDVTPVGNGDPVEMGGRRRPRERGGPSGGARGRPVDRGMDSGGDQPIEPQGEQLDPETKAAMQLAADLIQMGLDIGGIVDPTPLCDGASALMSLGKGDLMSVGISALAFIPLIGDAAKVGKLGKYGKTVADAIDLSKKNSALSKLLRPLLQNLSDLLKRLPLDKLPDALAKPLRKLQKKIDDFLQGAPKPPFNKVPPEQPPFDPSGTLGAAKAWTMKRRLKDAQLPTSGKVRYVPPKGYSPGQPLPRGPQNGFIDRFGNEWTRGPSRTAGQAFEWDVQLGNNATNGVKWASRDGKHLNVSLDGEVTH